jgi:hypothetical protein
MSHEGTRRENSPFPSVTKEGEIEHRAVLIRPAMMELVRKLPIMNVGMGGNAA